MRLNSDGWDQQEDCSIGEGIEREGRERSREIEGGIDEWEQKDGLE